MSLDAATEARLDELDRQNRRLKKWLAVVTAWLVIVWLFGGRPSAATSAAAPAVAAVPAKPQETVSFNKIRAREIIIEDEYGNNVIGLMTNGDRLKDGGGSIIFVANGVSLTLQANANGASIAAGHMRSSTNLAIMAGDGAAGMLMKHYGEETILHCDTKGPRLHMTWKDDGLQTLVNPQNAIVAMPVELTAEK